MRIKIQACGICHSDAMTKEGHWPVFMLRVVSRLVRPEILVVIEIVAAKA